MKKNVVKINENTLRKIVAESVKKVLKETTAGQFDGIGADYDGKFSKPKSFSYIGDATEQLDSLRLQLRNLLDHIDTLCKDMSDDEYAFGQMDSSRKTIDILRKIWPLVGEIYELWGYRNS